MLKDDCRLLEQQHRNERHIYHDIKIYDSMLHGALICAFRYLFALLPFLSFSFSGSQVNGRPVQ